MIKLPVPDTIPDNLKDVFSTGMNHITTLVSNYKYVIQVFNNAPLLAAFIAQPIWTKMIFIQTCSDDVSGGFSQYKDRDTSAVTTVYWQSRTGNVITFTITKTSPILPARNTDVNIILPQLVFAFSFVWQCFIHGWYWGLGSDDNSDDVLNVWVWGLIRSFSKEFQICSLLHFPKAL